MIEGAPKEEQGVIKSFLHKSKTNQMYSGHKSKDAKFAETHYKIIKKNENYTLADVNILTGRKNQIRVHFSDLGHPLVGDKNMVAINLRLTDLVSTLTKKLLVFKAKELKEFLELVK